MEIIDRIDELLDERNVGRYLAGPGGKPKGNYDKDIAAYAKELDSMEDYEVDDNIGDIVDNLANVYDMKSSKVLKDLKKKMRK